MRLGLCIVTLAFVIGGCNPSKPSFAAKPTREQMLSGEWTGKPVEEKSPKGEKFLSEQLGGYSITLNQDHTFSLDWRGLTKEGTWTVTGDRVKLSVTKVFDKTREQATAEKLTEDLKLFDDSTELKLSQDDKSLTLPSHSSGSQTVLFQKSPK